MGVTLSERLKTLSNMTVGRVCADIGTDHALLPCYLIETGRADYCYACDIAVGPLERAKKNIAKEGLKDKIETVLADGIPEGLCDKCDTVIIAGMGGELIADILKRGNIGENTNLVLQPMSRAVNLREYLNKNGFKILEETAFTDKGKTYSAIRAQKGADIEYPPAMLEAGRFILERRNETDLIYIKKRLASLRKQQRGENGGYYQAVIEEIEGRL